jgi:hypothetical protein
MSNEILVKTALKKLEVFKNLAKNLEIIKGPVLKLDPAAETYIFGSVAENKNNYSSDRHSYRN